jgi:hypothetical protein
VIELNPVLIQSAAARHNLPPLLLSALIEQESGGDPWAWNPEPRYRYLWDVSRNRTFRTLSLAEIGSEVPPFDFPTLAGDRDQEWWAQQASWGLMQVMGAVAREGGCRLPYLTALCGPDDNLEYGCRHLSNLRGRFMQTYGWPGVIAAYNAGSPRRLSAGGPYQNQRYVDEVTARLKGAQL